MDLKTITDGISLLGTAVSTVKAVVDILPKQDKEEVSKKLLEVEQQIKAAEAQIASGLGYELCKCTWPPQIMLYAGEAEYGEKVRCPACSRVVTPDDMPHLNNFRTI
jgi:hypothetical protein